MMHQRRKGSALSSAQQHDILSSESPAPQHRKATASTNDDNKHHSSTSSSSSSSYHPSTARTWMNALFYVLSGCSQPLIMTLCKNAGLADKGCQLFMFFYALGPATLIIPLSLSNNEKWPSIQTMGKAVAICLFDIVCQVANYTGASMAGPTIFAIVYSSVTIWCAVFSIFFLNRKLQFWQWIAILAVFGGLAITATDSLQLGDDVSLGSILIIIGSAMHSLTYIMSEGIMTISKETLSVRQNNAIQSLVASTTLGMWQIMYTLPRWDDKIQRPMDAAGTTYPQALFILSLLSFSNLIHSSTFFHTLRYFPGGSTSAGVMKGLQAVLVFVVTHLAFCGRSGGQEMCFTTKKLLALLTVSGGVICYGYATKYYYNSVAVTTSHVTTNTTPPSNNNNRKDEVIPLNMDGHRKKEYDHIA